MKGGGQEVLTAWWRLLRAQDPACTKSTLLQYMLRQAPTKLVQQTG